MGRALKFSLAISPGLILAIASAPWWAWPGPGREIECVSNLGESLPRPNPPPLRESGWTVSGLVLRKDADGDIVPASGVSVRKTRVPYWDDPKQTVSEAEATTGADGRFELAGVPSKVWLRLEIDDGENSVETLNLSLPDLGGTGREDLGVWLLRPGEAMAIQVHGPAGDPLKGATVRAWPFGEYISGDIPQQGSRWIALEGSREALELGNGECRIERLSAGPYRIKARAPGFAWTYKNIEFPCAQPVRLRLEPGQLISGVVETDEGAPIEGADVVAGISLIDGIIDCRARSDASGRFILDGLWRSEFEVSASADGFIDGYQDRIPAGTMDLRLALIPTSPLTGLVIADVDGSPVGDAEVCFSSMSWPSPEVRTDAQCFFQFKRLPPRLSAIAVRHVEFLKEEMDLSLAPQGEGGKLRVIRLKRGSTVSGKVIDSSTGAPIADATVTGSQPEDGELGRFSYRRSTRTHADGSFKLMGLAAASWTIEVKLRSYLAVNRLVPLDGLERVADLFFPLEHGGSIAGRVLDLDGNPIAAARVTPALDPPDGEEAPRVLREQTVATDPLGRFRVEGLPASSGLCLLAEGREFTRGWLERIQIQEGKGLDGIEIRLSRGGTIEGRVLDVQGEAVPGASVSIEGVPGWPESFRGEGGVRVGTETDEKGRYSLRRLRPGSYRIRVHAQGHATGIRDGIAVFEGVTIRGVDLVLQGE